MSGSAKEKLFSAARRGDVCALRRFVKESGAPDLCGLLDEYGRTMLFAAADCGRAETIRYLATVYAERRRSRAPLVSEIGPAQKQNRDCSREEDRDEKKRITDNTLRSENSFSSLLNVVDDLGRTALFYACGSGHGNAIEALAELGVNVYIRDTYGQTALYYAVARGHAEAARTFASSFSAQLPEIIDQSDTYGRTLMCLVAENGWPTMIELLVELGSKALVSPHLRDDGGETEKEESRDFCQENGCEHVAFSPLMCAMLKNRLASITTLLSLGADVNEVHPCGLSPLCLAFSADSVTCETLGILLRAGANVNFADTCSMGMGVEDAGGNEHKETQSNIEVSKAELILDFGGELRLYT